VTLVLDTRKPATAAQCVASDCVNPYPHVWFFRVVENGSRSPDLFLRPGRARPRSHPLRLPLGFARRVGVAIDGDWQKKFPETLQHFLKKIDFHRLLANLTFQGRDPIGIQSGLGLRTLAGNASSPLARHSLLQVSNRLGLS
jgi:hypothetical protein